MTDADPTMKNVALNDYSETMALIESVHPGTRRWVTIAKDTNNMSMGFVIFDLDKDDKQPLYVFTLDERAISHVIMLPGHMQISQLAFTNDEYNSLVKDLLDKSK